MKLISQTGSWKYIHFRKILPQFLYQIMVLSDFPRIKWNHASLSKILESALGNGAVSSRIMAIPRLLFSIKHGLGRLETWTQIEMCTNLCFIFPFSFLLSHELFLFVFNLSYSIWIYFLCCLPPALLQYHWHRTLCKFKVYNTMVTIIMLVNTSITT